MFQKACCQEIGWDDPLPNELYKELCCIIADLSKVSSIEIPRCLISEFRNDVKSVQLHGLMRVKSLMQSVFTFVLKLLKVEVSIL